MHGVPRAASAWPSDSKAAGGGGWRKSQRLLRASEFASFTGPDVFWRGARRWVSVSVRERPHAPPSEPLGPRAAGRPAMSAAVRFGFTVSRRYARRAVARNMVKRVLREAARKAFPRLEECAAGRSVDVLLRVKAALPGPAEAGWDALKGELRHETDLLLQDLARRLSLPRQERARGLAKSTGGADLPGADAKGARP